MEAAMDLMRRMPPGSAETALNALLSLLPDHSLDLLSQVDLPLQVYPLTPFPPAPLGSDRIGGAGAFRFVVLEIDRARGLDAPPAGAYVSFNKCAFVALHLRLPRIRPNRGPMESFCSNPILRF
jgi:hypothetical protein